MTTKTDTGGVAEWRIDDTPFRLRHWASDVVHLLPTLEGVQTTLGSDADIVLVDPDALVSHRHASITVERGRHVLRDLDSKNGVRVDGARRAMSLLEPGLEIVIGGITLIVESERFVSLRSFVARLLGWRAECLESVDLALRAIRRAAARRGPLVLCGAGDLAALAHGLHRNTLGNERPFVVCDPRRREGEATVRSAENYETGLAAIQAARGGTVCVWAKRLPRDYKAMNASLLEPATRVQKVVCAHQPADSKGFEVTPVVVPPLSTRKDELPHIVEEYARDARASLGSEFPFASVDRDWIIAHSAETLPEIEKATMRVVAIRKAGSIAAAAELLGMSHTSLLRWLGRRRLPTLGDRRPKAK